MSIFEELAEFGCEQILFCRDEATGLRAIVAIHDTTLGPALGGCRMWPYGTEEEAVTDVLRLSRGMTYKAAVSGLALGGGKSVIIGDPDRDKSPELFRAFGRFVDSLGGRYIVAEDVGTTPEDMERVRSETPHVAGLDAARGGSGDPSVFTALGVLAGMRACVEEVYGSPSLEGRTVAVQGLGHVGYRLCRLLHEEGARLVVADLRPDAVARAVGEFGAEAVEPAGILSVPCDVLAPCALGAVVSDATLPHLRCSVVAGSANNVLAEGRHGEALRDRGILYAPDYVINAGGLINVSGELEGYDEGRARGRVARIYDSVKNVVEISKRDGVPTNAAADRLALERLGAGRRPLAAAG
ncbi:leucine dehydrogenase [Rubrobacter marinus]|uniref:Leucine dehydrogenase n=1 Tax=Rubrobacter marinus TaxID=2653852 RepID=A0A6G8Q132_9ACTN|nr:Glu/Leu/Phe/Val dehydrogenase [Rubrobacter marinus]QIN80155.1 leucine dehydrogenase [Rubrobacter marinus]